MIIVTDIISGHAATIACTDVGFAGKGIKLVGKCLKDEGSKLCKFNSHNVNKICSKLITLVLKTNYLVNTNRISGSAF